MLQLLWETIKTYQSFLSTIKDVLIVTQFLVLSNYVICRYAKNGSYKGKGLWVYSFSSCVAVIGSKLFDTLNYIDISICPYVCQSISYYQLLLLLKNTGLLFGIDLLELITKNKPKQ